MDEVVDDPLPEDDSIFENISNRTDNISSDALIEDPSFSAFALAADGLTSTPSVGKSRKNKSTPTPTEDRSPSLAAGESSGDSPRRSPRLASRDRDSCGDSPRRSPRLTLRERESSGSSPKGPPRVRGAGRGRGASAVGPSSASTSSRSRKPPASSSRLKCPKCPASLANKKTLDTHLRGHYMKGIISRAPSLSELGQQMLALSSSALQDMVKEPVIGDLSELVHNYCLGMQEMLHDPLASELFTYLSEAFSEILLDKKVLFPSAIRSAFFSGVNGLLSSSEFRVTIKCHFRGMKESEESVLNVFVGDFTCTLGNKVLVFCLKKMRGELSTVETVRKKRSGDSVDSVEFRQLVYHIAGSVLNGFLWKGKQYAKSSRTWGKYYNALKNLLISESGDNQCADEVRHFSEAKDRGGYKHVTDDTFSFFLTVFDLLMSVEGEDGSLPSNVIDETVLGSDVVLCLWDALMGNYLNPDESLDLLIQICQTSVKVVMKGILKRRLNEHLKQAYNSVALRAKLGSN